MTVLNYFRFVLLEILLIALATGMALVAYGFAEASQGDLFQGPVVVLEYAFFGIIFSPLFSGVPVMVGGFLTHLGDRLHRQTFRLWALATGILAAVGTLVTLYFNGMTPEFHRFTLKSALFYGAIILPALTGWQFLALKYLRGGNHENR